MRRAIFILPFCLLLARNPTEAGPVKISFLDNEEDIKQTTKFLLSKGCAPESVSSFRRVIDWYNSTPTDLDLKKFPVRTNGFYSFESVSNLVEAFSRPLIFTKHQDELNCFETAILLTGNLIHTSLQPDDISGPFLPPFANTNNYLRPRLAATPRDAFSIIYDKASTWAEFSTNIFGGSMQNKRICLTTAFNSYYFLPLSTLRENFGTNLLQILQTSWSRQGIGFPKNIEVVICYQARLYPKYDVYAWSSHVGLLFQNQDQYVFIEKLGTTAPYVRFDFKDKNDLLLWLRAEIQPIMGKEDLLFATFNDHEVEDLMK